MKTDTAPTIFTWDGIRRGARRFLPLAFASFLGGTGFGILASDLGLGLAQAMGMSALVFAGASQMVAMDVWTFPPAVLGLGAAAFAINIRHVVMGAALRPWLKSLPLLRSHAALLMMTDANWAQAMVERRRGEADAAIIVGSGLVMWFGWVSGTGIGQLVGGVIDDPRTFGIDMIVPAFFALTLPALWPGVRRLHPWIVAAMAAALVHVVLPDGTWHVVVGGLAGAAVGGLSRE
ncbi:MAG: AzlC family ABC transporter permease [Thalassobaculaceae bacterium]|nr:AzlC family ABC transporter permease [Thalassobaculaceae bacterium]